MLLELRRGRAIGRRVTLSYQLETEIIRDAIFFLNFCHLVYFLC